MEPGIYIIGSDPEESYKFVESEFLSDSGPGWKSDLTRFGPFIHKTCSLPSGGRMDFFRAQNYGGPLSIFVTRRCTSSMDMARKLLDNNLLPPWGSVLAVEQSAGRGQKMRNWISPPGNLYGTWYWPVDKDNGTLPHSWIPLASLLAGNILAEGLEQTGISVKIKWPNDIVASQRKLSGILTENRGGRLLVGVGINIVYAPEDSLLRKDFVLPATNLNALIDEDVTPLDLWLRLVDSGVYRVKQLVSSLEPTDFVKLLEQRIAWIGRRILFRKETNEPFPAVITGLSEDGGLRISHHGREETVYTGSLIPDE